MKAVMVYKGGPGSGFHGHRGRPGKVGGSSSSALPVLEDVVDGEPPAPIDVGPEPVATEENTPSAWDKLSPEEKKAEARKYWIQDVMLAVRTREGKLEDHMPEHYKLLIEDATGHPYQYGDLEKLNAKLKAMLDKQALTVRVPSSVLNQIVADGRLKNQFETGTSEGALNPSFRREVENYYFHISETDYNNNELRPIYGAVQNLEEDYSDNTQHYGDVILALKDDVRERTTVSGYDTLDNYHYATESDFVTNVVTPLTNPNALAFTDEFNLQDEGTVIPTEIDLQEPQSESRPEYIEAQIHGGVSLNDVSAVFYEVRGGDVIDFSQGSEHNLALFHEYYPNIPIYIKWVNSNKDRTIEPAEPYFDRAEPVW